MKSIVIIGLSFLFLFKGHSQVTDASFAGMEKLPVLGMNGDSLVYPFAGGMNNCQFGSIDLNFDGSKDLVVFDRHGDRLLTFINRAIAGSIRYEFRPEYAQKMPRLSQWMELVDYNGDGKEDVFTYTIGGIKVFRNDSDTELHFTQVSFPYLVSMQGATLTNILVTYADYPAVSDIDNDGDKDILTFWGLGSFVEWHRNMSMERYGNTDSLEFVKSSNCWGRFAEGVESNIVILDTCVNFAVNILKNSDPKHTGSTLLAHDFTGDGISEIVIGDVDFPQLISLTNGGSSDTAVMIAQTTDFPGSEHPVNLVSFPVACMMDVNNDGKKDILCSPFDPSLVRSESSHCSWLYLGSGEKSIGTSSYQFIQDDFLQAGMLDMGSGAYPVFLDYDGDGLMDLVVGNFGEMDSSWYLPSTGLHCRYTASLTLLRNIGTLEEPAFRIITRDYLGLRSLGMQSLIPAVGDIDGDGDQDILCGNSMGKLIYIENIAGAGEPAEFIIQDTAYGQIDAGDFSAPQIFDLDQDGLLDIVCGKRNGQLSYFRNSGPQGEPQFVLVSDTLGGVEVTNTSLSYFGYSVPFFYRTNAGPATLLVGSEFGDIFVYTDIDSNLDGEFNLKGTLPGVKTGWRSAIALGDLDKDTYPDLFVGNYSGGLSFFQGTSGFPFGTENRQSSTQKYLQIRPNPACHTVILNLEDSGNSKNCIRIFSMIGRVVAEYQDVTFPFNLDVSVLDPCIYLVETNSGIGVSKGKLIVIE